MTVETTILDNGITVITDTMPHLESAAMGVWVRSGSRSETEKQHGISHVLEHMAFKGTAKRSAREIAETIESVGGDINAATSIEHTGYFARILKEDVTLGADILSDILQNSLFDENELTREKQVIVQEIGAATDTPDDLVFDLFQNAAYPGQPIGHSILGTEESVRSFSGDDIRSYMNTQYVGDQMVFSAAGNLSHSELVDIINDRFHNIKRTGASTPVPAKYIGGERHENSDNEQVQIVLGIEGRPYNSEGFYTAQILSSILGGGMSSRLFQEVRETRGLCYSVYAFHWAFADSGVFAVSAATGEKEVSDLIPVILEELQKASQTITDEEVNRVRAQIRAGLLMSLESPSSRAGQLARQQLLWGRPLSMQETVDRINRIDAERVKLIASQMFTDSTLTLASVGPGSALPSYDSIAKYLR